MMGGGFGRRGEADFSIYATLIAMQADGKPVKGDDDIVQAATRKHAGESVELTIIRGGRSMNGTYRDADAMAAAVTDGDIELVGAQVTRSALGRSRRTTCSASTWATRRRLRNFSPTTRSRSSPS